MRPGRDTIDNEISGTAQEWVAATGRRAAPRLRRLAPADAPVPARDFSSRGAPARLSPARRVGQPTYKERQGVTVYISKEESSDYNISLCAVGWK